MLPNIILYLASGYCFVKMFFFTSQKESVIEIKHALLSSLIAGFVICNTMQLIPYNISKIIDTLGIILTSAISGAIIGMIYASRALSKLTNILHIHRTPNQCIWLDVMSPDLPMRVKVTMKSGYVYTGCIHVMEEHSSRPPMALYTYKIIKDGLVVDDKTDCPNQALLIELADAEYIEVIYDENSVVCKDVIRYVDYVKGITSD